MQTFLPFSSYTESARCLDRQRLGKQRLETYQILCALRDPNYGWQNHPAVNMWRGYESCLAIYGLTICFEWIERGYKDNMYPRIENIWNEYSYEHQERERPPWIGNPHFHASHRAMLFKKDPEYYSGFYGTFDPAITDYYWPTKEES